MDKNSKKYNALKILNQMCSWPKIKGVENVTKEVIVQQIIDLHVNKEIYEKLAKS